MLFHLFQCSTLGFRNEPVSEADAQEGANGKYEECPVFAQIEDQTGEEPKDHKGKHEVGYGAHRSYIKLSQLLFQQIQCLICLYVC